MVFFTRFMLILVSFHLFCLCSLHATEFYFDSKKGDNTTAGTKEFPWKSLDKIQQITIAPGDKIYLHGNQTFIGNIVLDASNAGDPQKPVVIKSYSRGRAILYAGDGTGILVQNAGGVIIKNLEITGSGRDKNIGSGIRFENSREDLSRLPFVRIKDVKCSGFGGKQVYERNDKLLFYAYGEGIFVGGRPWLLQKCGYTDVIIEDCETSDNENCGIMITGPWDPASQDYANSNISILRCQSHHNSGDPDFLRSHSGSGILMEYTDGGLIDGCLAWENGNLCNTTSSGPCGIWAAASKKIILQNCESWNNRTGKVDGDGFDFDGGVSDSIIQYNYAHNNDGAGILLYSYDGAPYQFAHNTCRFNICMNNGRKNDYGELSIGSFGGLWENMDIYHNTLISTRLFEKNSVLHLMKNSQTRNVRILNNILISGDQVPLINGVDQEGLLIAGNSYWSSHGEFQICFNEKDFTALSEFRSVTKQERFQDKDTGFYGDPMIELPEKAPTIGNPRHLTKISEFRLKSNSIPTNNILDLHKEPFCFDLGKRNFFGDTASPSIHRAGAD